MDWQYSSLLSTLHAFAKTLAQNPAFLNCFREEDYPTPEWEFWKGLVEEQLGTMPTT